MNLVLSTPPSLCACVTNQYSVPFSRLQLLPPPLLPAAPQPPSPKVRNVPLSPSPPLRLSLPPKPSSSSRHRLDPRPSLRRVGTLLSALWPPSRVLCVNCLHPPPHSVTCHGQTCRSEASRSAFSEVHSRLIFCCAPSAKAAPRVRVVSVEFGTLNCLTCLLPFFFRSALRARAGTS